MWSWFVFLSAIGFWLTWAAIGVMWLMAGVFREPEREREILRREGYRK
jgi:hypothetical protein